MVSAAQQRDTPSTPHNVAGATVIKDEDLFFLCEPDGNVPVQGRHGLGLYYHDCRFLSGYEVRLAGQRLESLIASSEEGFAAVLQLANPTVGANGSTLIRQSLSFRWERVIDQDRLALLERFTIHNFKMRPLEAPLQFSFAAQFEDIFVVRGAAPAQKSKPVVGHWHGRELVFRYAGRDGLTRATTIRFSQDPDRKTAHGAEFSLRLKAREKIALEIQIFLTESRQKPPEPPHQESILLDQVRRDGQRSSDDWMRHETLFTSSHPLVNRVMERSLRDLRVLRSELHGLTFYAAGVPWYVTLFGRDSMLASLETLAYDPTVAEQTLLLLAKLQGTQNDPQRDEQPGKIMHELRVGELARIGAIPFTPYYGSVDSTPLFLILLERHARWTGQLQLFHELGPAVEKALAWMFEYGGLHTGPGYLAYGKTSTRGLTNQGWKDSGDAIVNADGTLAKPPIMLAEVQGYAYRALTGIADLYGRAGEPKRAAHLRKEAEALRRRFNRDFWQPKLGVFALALQKNGKPAAVVSSNAGQVLWSGIAPRGRGRQVARRLMEPDMFNGWGIRTLSSKEKRYNPIEYHLGTVWPHDNALIAAGFRRYGEAAAAGRVFMSLVEAGTHFAHDRLPEVFSGFRRDAYGEPVHYPTACHPQAWASGAIPYLVQTLLGLEAEAFERRLRILKPHLPQDLEWIELKRLRVGESRVDLRFARSAADRVAVTVLQQDGELEVAVE